MRIMRAFERPWIWLVIAINVAGAIFGFYWYEWQLLSSPLWQWIFIADCPISATLMAIALLTMALGRDSSPIKALASCCSIKYGLWTCLVILIYHEYFLSPENRTLYIGMFVAHALLACEGLLLLSRVKGYCLLAFGWLLLNDVMDYFVGTHPYLPTENLTPVAILTFCLSIFTFLLCFRGIKSSLA